MSRIHDALKKAEEERSSPLSAASITPQIQPSGRAPENPPIPAVAADPNSAPTQEQWPHFDFPELQARSRPHSAWTPDPQSDVFGPVHKGNAAEQFRTLRSRLYQYRGSHALKTLLVTSSMAGEGKTFVTANLVRAFVRQAERRVLVIDADLRRPRLHTIFGAPPSPGLSDYLRGNADEFSIIQHGKEGNLCLIPCGESVNHPSELLSNGRLKILLDRLAPAFDWIIIDSPPCLPVADAGIVSHWCDGLLLVVRAAFTPSALVLKSKQELKQRNIVGVVLNAAAEGTSYGSYQGSYSAEASN
jgi:capsular exopolysaccharide synthesis family protein